MKTRTPPSPQTAGEGARSLPTDPSSPPLTALPTGERLLRPQRDYSRAAESRPVARREGTREGHLAAPCSPGHRFPAPVAGVGRKNHSLAPLSQLPASERLPGSEETVEEFALK